MNRQPPEVTPEMLQQHPELMVAWMFVFALLMLYLVGAVASWIYFGRRAYQGQPLLTVDPWSPRAWGFVDLVLVAVAAVIGQTAAVLLGGLVMGQNPRELAGNGEGIPLTLAFLSGLGNLVAMLMITVWICLRFGVGPRHSGFTLRRLPKHLLTGLLVGLAMLPVVYFLMFLVSIGLKTQYAHPLLDQITKDRSLTAYLLGVAAAAIFAPLTEEFLFRVVLQGWLQSLPFKSLAANVFGALPTWMQPAAAVGVPQSSEAANEQNPAPEESEPAASVAGEFSSPPSPTSASALQTGGGANVSDNPYIPTASLVDPAESPTPQPGEVNVLPPIWPSIVTGILFGLAHWGYGLSFIPLIFMGIVLGLVYRATHSIWPCVLIHCMLNGTSMLFLGVLILQQNAVGP